MRHKQHTLPDETAPAAAQAWTKVLARIREYGVERDFAPVQRLKPQRIDAGGRLVMRGSPKAVAKVAQAGLVLRLRKLVEIYGIATGVLLTSEGPGGLDVTPKPLPKAAKKRRGLQSVGDILSAAAGLPAGGGSAAQAAIALEGPRESHELGFLHSFLAQAFLPRSKPKGADGRPVREWSRRAGNLVLALTAGRIVTPKKEILLALPYGSKPRLLQIDICTRAIQTRSPVIDMERTTKQYLERLRMGWGAGPRGQYTLFKNQAISLSACRMEFLWLADGQSVHYEGTPIRGFRAWRDDGEGQRALWPGELRLDPEFYQTLLRHGLPLDMRAVRELGGSALALDWYTFFAQRLRRIPPGETVEVSWRALRDAMGQEYGRVRNFKAKSVTAIKRVMDVYPGLADAVESVPGGLRLKRCPPPVAERKSKLLGSRS